MSKDIHTLMQEAGEIKETCIAGSESRPPTRQSSAAVTQQRKNKDRVDFYPTPPSTTRLFLDWLEQRYNHLSVKTCWEPAAGNLDMSKELEKTFGHVYSSDYHDPAELGLDRIDFADQLLSKRARHDWIITNPPFSLAAEFIHNGLRYSDNGCAMLVRIAFLEGLKRYNTIFKERQPTDVCVYVKRQSMSYGKVDEKRPSAMCFAWVVWDKNRAFYRPNSTSVHWLI